MSWIEHNMRVPEDVASRLVSRHATGDLLVGRTAERARISTLVEAARDSRGGALVVHGEAGVGKTALLDAVITEVTDIVLLRTQGIESESPLAFAALYRLLRPALRHLDRLPAPQARALRVAFGVEDGTLNDRFVVFMATLTLLTEAAEVAPVVCVVDDAHWLDLASAEALLFVARRLQADRVAMVFGARDDDVRRFDAPDLDGLQLTGIDRAAAHELLSARAGVEVTDEVCDRLMARTGGNPLGLVELPTVLSPEQLTGQARLPRALPITDGIERAFVDRCRRLPADAQTLLLVAATDDSGSTSTVLRAAARFGAGADALDAVERSGLLTIRGPDVALRHPLVRSAVYGAATTIERRRVHQALADALDGEHDADRRAWHLSHTTDDPDEAIAAALEKVGESARRRGGHEAASAAYERAAELTAEAGRRARRLHAAAMTAWLAAQLERARTLAEEAHLYARDLATRADIDALRGRIAWNTGARDCGEIVLRAALELTTLDPARAVETAMLATSLVAITGEPVDPAPVLRAVPAPNTPRGECVHALLAGHGAAVRGAVADAATAFRRALHGGPQLDELDILVNQAVAAMWLGADDEVHRRLSRIDALTRDTGAVTFRLYVASRMPLADIPAGNWDAVAQTSSEALALAPALGRTALGALPWAWLSLLAALRGDAELDQVLTGYEGVRAAAPTGIFAVAEDVARWARGVAAASAGDTGAALHHLCRITLPVLQRLAALDRIEAAVRAGEPETAQAWTADIEEFARATDAAWAAATAAHGQALLEPVDPEPRFRAALAHHEGSLRPIARARTQLAYGEFLRRSRRRVAAREHLRAALETFLDVGAAPWADRARHELRASGETTRRRHDSTLNQLTPQEMQIARLAAAGLSNRDIANQCFLSVRTVEFHLSNVYSKLRIRSRAALAQLIQA